jgi:hypothetical protein
LRDADPELRDPMPFPDPRRVRQAVVIAAREGRAAPAPSPWYRPVVVLAAMSMIAGAGVTTAWHTGAQKGARRADPVHAEGSGAAPGDAGAEAPAERQLLHFATPGGTRIIWVFDSSFEMGTLP